MEKNSRYNKTEIIKDVTINNIKINKTDTIGETKIYKPVEDEKVIRENYVTYLKMFFEEVYEADDGEKAYELYKTKK